MSESGVAVVIEDDEDVRNLVDAILKEAGFVVHSASTGREGVEVVRDKHAAVVTLDVGLPDMDGHEVLRRIRQFSDAYVVMLTARNDEPDTLTAFLTGADDYITKPFLPRELRARITAMMRRPRGGGRQALPQEATGGRPVLPDGPDETVFKHNGLALNYKARMAALRGSVLMLTRSEFDLLFDLLRSNGEVRTRADLVRAARGSYYDDNAYISEADERAVESHIGNLRRKLGEDPQSPRFLQTVRGVGYRLAPKRPD
ncbi:response regulator transcription factor [Arthrobacter bambusae]|uniref:response regulator transcription factor n=1 Tax=Arthrobacter bambusae TaxID=1338426 RepID=UPI00278A955E|nr:response regulator transcription factor [Arthrobacter bambusae]MDQ0212634.1 DNA-binding response OmpR family regulator [Arthrobacter bambusae]MDQ0237089.1 DNA-binding response OmpR family regulator [Arthrobacter bambusae]